MPHNPTLIRSLLALAGFLAVCFGVAASGAFFQPGEWFAQLAKPSWNPPSWLFAPVWTLLYALMAIAAWRVWRADGWHEARLALAFFFVQLLLNALWSYLFFGLHRPDLALIDIVLLLTLINVTALQFRHHDAIAAALFIPYTLWVAFATALNFSIWRLNS